MDRHEHDVRELATAIYHLCEGFKMDLIVEALIRVITFVFLEITNHDMHKAASDMEDFVRETAEGIRNSPPL